MFRQIFITLGFVIITSCSSSPITSVTKKEPRVIQQYEAPEFKGRDAIADAHEMHAKGLKGLIYLEYGEGIPSAYGVNLLYSSPIQKAFSSLDSDDSQYIEIKKLIDCPWGNLTIFTFDKGLSKEQETLSLIHI